MGAYVVRRLLLLIPTLFAIMLVNFAVVQIVPGGPIERVLAQLDKSAGLRHRAHVRRRRRDARHAGAVGQRGREPARATAARRASIPSSSAVSRSSSVSISRSGSASC